MSRAPRVGLPPCLDASERIRRGRRTHYLEDRYAAAISEAGGTPLYLPSPAPAASLLDSVDALLVPGGDDFPPPDPAPPGVEFELVSAEQLAFDRALLDGALERRLPVLGICYGMQLLCLAHGGALVYDLPSERPDAGPHKLDETEGRHALRVQRGSRLASSIGDEPPGVNSLHHQAVADPGVGLVAVAWADDGTIEAVEHTDPARFTVGVQWHPEKMLGLHRDRLFGALVEAARRV